MISREEFKELWESDLTQGEIARRIGVTSSSVGKRAKSCGLPPRTGSEVVYTRMIEDPLFPTLYARGASRLSLQEYYGCTTTSLTKAVRKLKLSRKVTRWDTTSVADLLSTITTDPQPKD